MVSIQKTKEVSNIFVAEIFLELLANIFDTFIFDHTVPTPAAAALNSPFDDIFDN